MKQRRPNVSLEKLCLLFGVTRQAYYEASEHEQFSSIAHVIVLTLVKDLRAEMPLLGTRKLQFLLHDEFEKHNIKIGRDQLFVLLRFHGLLIRRRQRFTKTTNSHHWLKKYPNLIESIIPTGSNQIWVSDITYIRTISGFNYLSLITDAYSRKIVGYYLCETLAAIGPTQALLYAVGKLDPLVEVNLIHHSDRGIQYCSSEYITVLDKYNISISMTQSGSPYENALAERVNGIIKNEFFPKYIYRDFQAASLAISKIITLYNTKRPHASIDFMTPEVAHELEGTIVKRWKKPVSKTALIQESEMG